MNATKYLDRLKYMNELVKTRRTGSVKELAGRLRISESHLYRLIKDMKDMGAPIEFCRQSNCYYYTREYNLNVKYSVEEISEKGVRKIYGGFFRKKPLTIFL